MLIIFSKVFKVFFKVKVVIFKFGWMWFIILMGVSCKIWFLIIIKIYVFNWEWIFISLLIWLINKCLF